MFVFLYMAPTSGKAFRRNFLASKTGLGITISNSKANKTISRAMPRYRNVLEGGVPTSEINDVGQSFIEPAWLCNAGVAISGGVALSRPS